ncbi:MAG TPA: hypothetical protein P5083_01545 [Candidatus Paceibacterota bacterium]|nr:hypothetical protein [Candidatus Paceibacterota bacterium]
MNFNKIEERPQQNPKEDKFGEIIERLTVLIDLLSDADFRNKFPEFVKKYQITIEQAKEIKALSSTELDTELTFREHLESLLEEAREIRRNIHPEDRNTINYIVEILERSLNSFNN